MKSVREFAERVLMGTTLEEKLAPPPPELEIEDGGAPWRTPAAPGRPEGLELRRDGVRAEFPGAAGIESDEERGKLLHFFANHELLATELMALVLLKFPDAPREFRAGVLKTLKEEQMHTKMYLRRMEECGVRLGDLPVNGFFWNLVSTMETPLDYVTRLSLTFEQANLDYAKGYGRVFGESGDAATAAILNRIYEDEIGHVHYGLEWFRRWKEEKSDWKSFCSLLSFPLSAARAKGAFEFNAEGRRRAGLDEEFIRELKVFSQSKGRTPDVYLFNPGAEEILEGGEESEAMRTVARDLGLLMAFLASREDVVVVESMPERDHLESLVEAGLPVPELVGRSDLGCLRERKLGRACPWAGTPEVRDELVAVGAQWRDTAADLFSKITHQDFLRGFLAKAHHEIVSPPEVCGRAVTGIPELESLLAEAKGPMVIKCAFSTAGRDRLMVNTEERLPDRVAAWVRERLGEGRALVCEPWLDGVLDFSVQYDLRDDGRMLRRGFVVMQNSETGRFQAARVVQKIINELELEDRRCVFSGTWSERGLVGWLEDEFEPALAAFLMGGAYAGPVGVDMLFYRDGDGALRLKPVVEINPRFTMGRVAVELDRARGGKGATALLIRKVGEGAPEGAVQLTPVAAGTRLVAWVTTR